MTAESNTREACFARARVSSSLGEHLGFTSRRSSKPKFNMVLQMAPRFPGCVTPTRTTQRSNSPRGNGKSRRSPKSSTPRSVHIIKNPSRITRLVQKKHKTSVFPVVHHKGPFAKVVLCLEMLNQQLKFVSVVAVNTHGLPVPVDPERHANTINRYGADGIG